MTEFKRPIKWPVYKAAAPTGPTATSVASVETGSAAAAAARPSPGPAGAARPRGVLKRHPVPYQGTVLEGYVRKAQLGEGTYGSVCVYEHPDPKKMRLAVKRITFAKEDEGLPASVIREVANLHYLNSLQCPYIIKMFDVITNNEAKYVDLVFECMDSDLGKLITGAAVTAKSANSTILSLPPEFIRSVMFQVLKAIDCCHANSVVHRDIKPANIFVNRNSVVKLGDFGLSLTFVPTARYGRSVDVVTQWYRDIRLYLGENNYTESIDLWAVGCVFAEMILGKPLFPGHSDERQLEHVFRIWGVPSIEQIGPITGHKITVESLPNILASPRMQSFQRHNLAVIRRNDLFRTWSDLEFDLLARLLCYDASKRLTAKEALKHPYFSECHAAPMVFSQENKAKRKAPEPMKPQTQNELLVYCVSGVERATVVPTSFAAVPSAVAVASAAVPVPLSHTIVPMEIG
jgi:serine/threonine protein kinase